MNEKELKIFRELDDKLYLISENNTYKQMFSEMDKNVNNDNIQWFINQLAGWYYVKYSDKYIALMLKGEEDAVCNCQIDLMNFDKLLCRLNKLISKENDNALLYYKHLIIMAGWKMIYLEETIPEYGYFRAQKLFEDFNQNFNLDLDINVYDSIMNANYSYDDPEIRDLLTIKREKMARKKRRLKIKNLFRR